MKILRISPLMPLLAGALALWPPHASAQDGPAVINTLIQHEMEAGQHRGHYTYTSEEKSDRTAGHWWTERVAETQWGKVRFLIAEDGNPLSADRTQTEKNRIAAEAADPEGFKKQESARADDEQHARQMLTLLPKAFLFDTPTVQGDEIRVGFRPNPDYQPQGVEEKVLHNMSGAVLIDRQAQRLRGIDGRMYQDVTIGFGLATIKAGSNFKTERMHVEGPDWKTLSVHTDFNGKVIMLKSLARQQESKRRDYKKIPDNITIADAAKIIEQ